MRVLKNILFNAKGNKLRIADIRFDEKIEEIISEINYTIYKIWLHKNALQNLEPIEQIGMNSDIDQCDYIFVPKNKIEIFESYYQKWLLSS